MTCKELDLIGATCDHHYTVSGAIFIAGIAILLAYICFSRAR